MSVNISCHKYYVRNTPSFRFFKFIDGVTVTFYRRIFAPVPLVAVCDIGGALSFCFFPGIGVLSGEEFVLMSASPPGLALVWVSGRGPRLAGPGCCTVWETSHA